MVTNVSTVGPPASWLPQLPENQNVEVRDYRFTQTVTNWQTVSYAVTNQFYQRTNSYVGAAVRIHKETKPMQLEAVKIQPVNYSRIIWVGAAVLLLAVTAVWWIAKR